jgi:hypothetical protein
MNMAAQLVETELGGETCPSATLATTNSTLPERGWKPATDCLTYDTAEYRVIVHLLQEPR